MFFKNIIDEIKFSYWKFNDVKSHKDKLDAIIGLLVYGTVLLLPVVLVAIVL